MAGYTITIPITIDITAPITAILALCVLAAAAALFGQILRRDMLIEQGLGTITITRSRIRRRRRRQYFDVDLVGDARL